MNKIKYFIILTFLFLTCFFIIKDNASTKRILILQSYNSDYSWTKDVDIGIKRVFGDDMSNSYRWHYMDTKNHPDPKSLEKAGIIARSVIDSVKPDVIIAVDDDAQEYVTKYYVNNPSLKIVFSGVNASIEKYNFDKANNVTGILERIPLSGLREMLQSISKNFDKAIRVVHISDNSKTVQLDDAFMKSYKNWHNLELLPSKLVSTFEEWKKAVIESQEQADYILVSNCRKIYCDEKKQKLASPKEVIKWTIDNSKTPVIAMNAFVVEDGALIAIAASPYEQGEEAARMALKIVNENILEPIKSTSQFVIAVREEVEEKYPIFANLPAIYTSFARYASKFYKKTSIEKKDIEML